jgi:hypothetical protein
MSTETKARRFVIEGEWTGYSSSQQRVVHRTVHPASYKRLRTWAEKTYGIRYTDGTLLLLRVRDAKPRERVQVMRGYDDLIRDCQFYDVDSVAALTAKKAERKAAHKEEQPA